MNAEWAETFAKVEFRLVFLFVCMSALILISLCILYACKSLARGWHFKWLFKDFKRKIYMTMCLGSIFFSLYTLVVTLSVYVVHESGIDLFLLAHEHPIECVYGGLWLFSFLSLSIYLTRMIVKYFYLTRGKEY